MERTRKGVDMVRLFEMNHAWQFPSRRPAGSRKGERVEVKE